MSAIPLRAVHPPDRPRRRSASPRPGEPDSLRLYLQEIGTYPLLSRDEEAALARRARAGDGEALDALVRANLRFVVSVAKKYRNEGVPLLDLVSEGNVGLLRAAQRFDETKGIRFISFAVWWVRQAILQALVEQTRVVRLPLGRARALSRLGRRASRLLQELGREPTAEELAAELQMSEAEVMRTLSLSRRQLSLDAPTRHGEDDRLLDYLRDDDGPAPDERTDARELAASVEAALAALRPREAHVLRLYFGLDGEEPRTLEDIGALLGITRERVRQVKEKALARLRHGRGVRLESFVG